MDEKLRELLELVFRKCLIITAKSKTDVWFNYSPHTNSITIDYVLTGYKHGENEFNDYKYIALSETISQVSLTRISKELDKLWVLIEENNLKKS